MPFKPCVDGPDMVAIAAQQFGGEHPVDLLVFHQKNSQRARLCHGPGGWCADRLRQVAGIGMGVGVGVAVILCLHPGQIQVEPECGALTLYGVDADAPAHGLHQPLADGKGRCPPRRGP